MIKFTKRKDIDIDKWDSIVASSNKNAIFSYSWYLDAVSSTWGVVHNSDWTISMPISYKVFIFWIKVHPPLFSRNLSIFGNTQNADKLITFALKNFWICHLKLDERCNLYKNKLIYQKIDLTEEIQYHKNTTRILKKNFNKYTFKKTKNYKYVLQFYYENAFKKLGLSSLQKIKIQKLMTNAILKDKAEVIEVFDINLQRVGASFFLMDKNTVYYLVGDCDFEEKKGGLMFSLMDFAITEYKRNFSYFDFGGSNIESVATFYRKLGGKDYEYFEYIK
ncbi:MAG: hypothetical protein HYU67_13450 [Flavobacteriia bacterium]|nr:hypothetical protein [Flavobacteriia bacterium]